MIRAGQNQFAMGSGTGYTFRQATHDDYEFLYQLHAASMRTYIELLWGWEESWQQEYFARKFDPSQREIIVIDAQDAGVLVVEEDKNEIYLSLIEILPTFQRRGVGTAIISSLLEKARKRGQPLSLHVLKSNRPARRLYERLGFSVVSEEDYRFKMSWFPPEKSQEG